MARLNLLNLGYRPRTHEGAPARNLTPEFQLRRSVLACLLWESQFYEGGIEIAGRVHPRAGVARQRLGELKHVWAGL
jgi:hypothetical protein